MSMYSYNESMAQYLAYMHHQQLMREFDQRRLEREQMRSLQAERASHRQFRLLYRLRHWMHRLLPGMAKAMFF